MKSNYLFTLIFCLWTLVIYSQDYTICANEIVKLHAGNHQEGSIQWQISIDNQNWTDIPEAKGLTYEFEPKHSAYYRVLNKFSYCEPNVSPVTLVLTKPKAVTSKNRLVNGSFTFIVGNSSPGATSSWEIIDGTNGVIESASESKTRFEGTTGSYKLKYTLENQCGTSSDTLNLNFVTPTFYDKIVVVDETDEISSTPTQLENGEYIISFNEPIPAIDNETILIGLQGEGFMRKVNSFSNIGNTFTIATSQAFIEEVITSGGIEIGQLYNLNDPINVTLRAGGSDSSYTMPTRQMLQNNTELQTGKHVFFIGEYIENSANAIQYSTQTNDDGEAFSLFNFDNTTLYEYSGENGNATVKLNGGLTFEPNLVSDIDVSFIPPRVNYAYLGMENAKLNFDASVNIDANFSLESEDYTFAFPSIHRKFIIVIGGVPTVVNVRLKMNGKVKLNTDGALEYEYAVNNLYTVTAGLSYNDGQWGNVFNSSNQFSTSQNYTANASVGVNIEVGPITYVTINGVLGGYLDTKMTSDVTFCASSQNGDINWNGNIDLGTKITPGIHAYLFKTQLFDYSKTWENRKRFTEKLPHLFEYISGNNQQYSIGNPLQNTLKVRTLSKNGFYIPNAIVYFDVLNNSGTLSQSSVFTNSQGIAEVNFTPTGQEISQVNAYVKNCEFDFIQYAPFTFTCYNNLNPICENSSLTASIIAQGSTIQPLGNLGTPPYTYSTDGVNFSSTPPVITPTASTLYNFTVKDANDCLAYASHQGLAFSCNNTDLGVNFSLFGNTVKAEAYGGLPPYEYALIPGNSDFSDNDIFNNLNAGSKLLRVKDANNCIALTVFEITDPSTQLIAYFDAPVTVQPNESITLANYSNNAISYNWDFGNGETSTETNPTISYTNNGTFTITLTASNGTLTNEISRQIEVATVNNNHLGIETVSIPAGTFTMGSPTTEPNRGSNETQHQVTLSAFQMSKFEITCSQYANFLNSVGVTSDRIWSNGPYPTQELIHPNSTGIVYVEGQWIPTFNRENAPIVNVKWFGAASFAQYAGGRLPTEAEWEYAARGGTNTAFYTGECLNNTQANYRWTNPQTGCTNTSNNYPNTSQIVGNYPPNSYGLYDMHGNVWEWCSDWYDEYSPEPTINPTGSTTGTERIFRGGSWISNASLCRSALRFSNPPTGNNSSIGFRIVF